VFKNIDNAVDSAYEYRVAMIFNLKGSFW